eukprot:scaffold34510_cov52-Phaeocystis_antarctica.AAC.2
MKGQLACGNLVVRGLGRAFLCLSVCLSGPLSVALSLRRRRLPHPLHQHLPHFYYGVTTYDRSQVDHYQRHSHSPQRASHHMPRGLHAVGPSSINLIQSAVVNYAKFSKYGAAGISPPRAGPRAWQKRQTAGIKVLRTESHDPLFTRGPRPPLVATDWTPAHSTRAYFYTIFDV